MELGKETIARLKARAGNAEARSETAAMNAASVNSGDMLARSRAEIAAQPEEVQAGVREYLAGMNTPFAGMIVNNVFGDGSQAKGLMGMLGGLLGGKQIFASMGGEIVAMGGRRKPTQAPPPAGEGKVAVAEAKLGFPLPAELRQIYVEVADGGVGPGDGIYSLKQLLAKWHEMTDEPVGPRGQKWPAHLLPVNGDDWDLTCIDMKTGRIVYFDIEEVDYGGWKKCFRDEAASLEAWLGEWLATPTAAQKAALRTEPPAPKQLTDEDWEVWAAESPDNAEYIRRLDIAAMTPEERAAIGLTEDNWAEKMFEGLDLSKIKPPTPGYADRRRAQKERGE
jgi:hypothetical protein